VEAQAIGRVHRHVHTYIYTHTRIHTHPRVVTGVEAQAIGRVHRIGQTRATVVHRHIIDNSVEVRVLQVNRQKQRQVMQQGGLMPRVKVVKHAEVVSMEDLETLFGGSAGSVNQDYGGGGTDVHDERSGSSSSGQTNRRDGSDASSAFQSLRDTDEAHQRELDDNWWRETVVYEGANISRERVLRSIQCAASAQMRASTAHASEASGAAMVVEETRADHVDDSEAHVRAGGVSVRECERRCDVFVHGRALAAGMADMIRECLYVCVRVCVKMCVCLCICGVLVCV
jgi:hypothetical protein